MAQDRKNKESLKAREYRDEQGDVHHHTKSYMEQRGSQSGGARAKQGGPQHRGESGDAGQSENGLHKLFL